MPLLGTLRSDAAGRILRLSMAVFALIALGHAYLSGFYIGYTDRDALFVSGRYTQVCLSIPALLLVPTMAIAHAARLRQRRVWIALLWGFAGVFASTVVAVLWWLMAGTSVAFGLVVVFVLSGLITFALVRYLRALPQPGTQTPVEGRGRTLAHAGHVALAAGAAFFIAPFMGLGLLLLGEFFWLGTVGSGLLMLIATTLVSAGVAVALVRFMGIAPSDRPDTLLQRRWRIVLIAGLTLIGVVSTHNASWALGHGVFFFDEEPGLWGLIVAVALSALIAFGLVRFLARLQVASEDDHS